jgi:alpha-galactosidase
MSIYYDDKEKVFYLNTKDSSYIMSINKHNYLCHVYFGKKVNKICSDSCLKVTEKTNSPNPIPDDKEFSLDTTLLEYPSYGNSDFRHPAYQVQLRNGSTITDLRFHSYKIYKGKPKLDGLPATYVENQDEADTLEIVLLDDVANIQVILIYTVFRDFNAIARSVRFENKGNENLKLLSALSMSLDFRDDDFDMLQLSGAWARERYIIRRPLVKGIQAIDSTRGASSHQQNPFIALMRKNADEYNGEVYGFSFVYSGNFLAQVEVDPYGVSRVTMGINPFDFTWVLEPGEKFQTPEVVMVYSDNGLSKMSQTYHKLYRERLARGKYRDKERPILINNWEATYFDFNEEKLKNIIDVASDLGIELFVLDDGWFGKRNSDDSSLGDWFVNRDKLPNGLNGIAEFANKKGMGFGLWVEPEMISPNSELYRKHPDWCLHVPNRPKSQGRNQYVLDLSRNDVCEYIIEIITYILRNNNISYVKWDMNRNMTEIGSAILPPERQRETAHRYILGLYKILEKITSDFPDILFESCAGGGGRFDPGMLYYMPQTWTSDNTDAIERLKIQYGTSIVYPLIAMGAHVSAVPNHQVGRMTSIKIRGDVAMSANLGYELDPTKLSIEEKEIVKEQVKKYKEIRGIIQFGDFYRLISPFESKNECAWVIVTEDKKEFIFYYFRILANVNKPIRKVNIRGINPDYKYRLDDSTYIYGGDELMYVGLSIPELSGDFTSLMYHFKVVD